MRRVLCEKRPNAIKLVQSQGLVYADNAACGGEKYWPDDCYYSFTQEEISLLDEACKAVFDMCCEAAEHLVTNPDKITQDMAIPEFALKQIKETWDREPAWASVYGRFDVCFGGLNHADPRLRVPKFYEFNADTPTTLLESTIIQWKWLEHTGHGNYQWNGVSESLVEAWKRNLGLVEEKLGRKIPVVYFATGEGQPNGEDAFNTMVLEDTCAEAGWKTKLIMIEEICMNKKDGRFYDPQGNHIDVIFKLYPWEVMVTQDFGEACFRDMENVGKPEPLGGTIWIEPPYKMLWSNKAFLAVLWDLFKDDPRGKYILPTYLEKDRPESMTSFCRKPIFSREGVDTTLQDNGKVIQDTTEGYFGAEGYVVQELALLPEYKDEKGSHYPVLGLWMVDGVPEGLAIREDIAPITTNTSVFRPHSIEDGPVLYERKDIPSLLEIEKDLMPCGATKSAGEEDELTMYIKKIVLS